MIFTFTRPDSLSSCSTAFCSRHSSTVATSGGARLPAASCAAPPRPTPPRPTPPRPAQPRPDLTCAATHCDLKRRNAVLH